MIETIQRFQQKENKQIMLRCVVLYLYCLNVKDNVYQDQTDGNYITILVAPGHGPPTLGSPKNIEWCYIFYDLYIYTM